MRKCAAKQMMKATQATSEAALVMFVLGVIVHILIKCSLLSTRDAKLVAAGVPKCRELLGKAVQLQSHYHSAPTHFGVHKAIPDTTNTTAASSAIELSEDTA